jgi:hypothetical protein
MKRLILTLVLALIPRLSFAVARIKKSETLIIKESISSYPGNCPCPYNTMRNGRSCVVEVRTVDPAASPLCYPKDVTDQMVKTYRAQAQFEVALILRYIMKTFILTTLVSCFL